MRSRAAGPRRAQNNKTRKLTTLGLNLGTPRYPPHAAAQCGRGVGHPDTSYTCSPVPGAGGPCIKCAKCALLLPQWGVAGDTDPHSHPKECT